MYFVSAFCILFCLSVFQGRTAVVLLERPAVMGGIKKSGFVRDLPYGQLGVLQKVPGLFQAYLLQIAAELFPCLLFKQRGKIRLAQKHLLRYLL